MTFVILCITSKLPQKTSLCCNDNKSHSDYPEKHFPIKITSDGRSERFARLRRIQKPIFWYGMCKRLHMV